MSQIRTVTAMAANLETVCTEYAKRRPGVLVDGRIYENQNGVMSADFETDDATYHLAMGYDGYCRVDGNKVTQDFLRKLPSDWVKTTLKLDTTAINKAAPSEKLLTKHGLTQKPKNEWSAKTDAAEARDWEAQ